jgi:hypothetical protein
MKLQNLSCLVLAISIGLFACTKNSNPQTIYDTVTVTKTDTVQVPPLSDTPNLTNGLVLYLPFNGSFADSSGLNNPVTTVNGATLGYDMHGYAQSAFNEAGNGGVLLVGNNGSYGVDTAFSLSLDFMIRSYPYYAGGGNYSGLQCLLSLVNYSNGNGATFVVGFTDPLVPTDLLFGVNSAAYTCDGPGDTVSGQHFVPTSWTPQLGAWYNLICTFSQGNGNIYINGQLINSQKIDTTAVLFCSNSSLIIGGWWGATEPLNGEIDELRMYNRSLTAQQIAWLARNFQINSTGQKPGLRQGGNPGLN